MNERFWYNYKVRNTDDTWCFCTKKLFVYVLTCNNRVIKKVVNKIILAFGEISVLRN